jgi:hypothetical protein
VDDDAKAIGEREGLEGDERASSAWPDRGRGGRLRGRPWWRSQSANAGSNGERAVSEFAQRPRLQGRGHNGVPPAIRFAAKIFENQGRDPMARRQPASPKPGHRITAAVIGRPRGKAEGEPERKVMKVRA